MDKRTAWVSGMFFLVILLAVGGMYYGQSERLHVLQRESKEKDAHIHSLTNQIAQSQSQMKEQQQDIKKLQQKVEEQEKVIKEVKKNANF